jgi:hypothetical protein
VASPAADSMSVRPPCVAVRSCSICTVSTSSAAVMVAMLRSQQGVAFTARASALRLAADSTPAPSFSQPADCASSSEPAPKTASMRASGTKRPARTSKACGSQADVGTSVHAAPFEITVLLTT